jgi:type IV pilus assembly protein PilY1
MNNNKYSTLKTAKIKAGFGSALTHFIDNCKPRRSRQRWALWLTVPVIAAVSFLAMGTSTAPAIPAITLSADPLYATATGDKPVLALALSVEYPTVGAQYVDPDNNNNATSDDVTYSSDREYLGYYDAESCYTYDNAGTGAPTTDQIAAYKRFIRRGKAIALSVPVITQPTKTTRMCWNKTTSYTKDDGTTPASSNSTNDAFSGNFLNWASSSAIDMLRLSLTGGDRVIDTSTLTVLQRAIIPDGVPINMGNSSNFPSKQLSYLGTSRAITSSPASPSFVSGVPFFGAIPNTMATTAGIGDIYVANTLNRIYFGTGKSGNNSGSFGSYTLGSSAEASLPSDTTYCADENNKCEGFSGTKDIWYGANSSWKVISSSKDIKCNNDTFGDPIEGIPKKCYYRNAGPIPSSGNLNSDRFFYARVQVCDRNPTTYALKDVRDYGLCKKYSDGADNNPQPNYKPSGAIQKYSDQLRLAAFGYLLDQTASYSSGGRYGGVLRAPIKYVGAKTFNINGVDNTVSGGNPNAEWNATTGVFNLNPDANSTVACAAGSDCSASYLSGVISYVNQFGRTGSIPGRYKIYDPVGELHYETLRYLQGLPPSADAISSITTAMQDGFPVSTTWTDPYGGDRLSTSDYSCLKSNIVVIGDINTHDGNRLPTASAANNIPDIGGWRTVVRNFESNTSSTYTDGQGVSRTTSNPNGANGSAPSNTGTSQILGSAYWAHTQDIRGTSWTNATVAGTAGTTLQRPGLRVKTFTFDVNEYGGSNSASTRRSSNQLFMAGKYGGFETDASNPARNSFNTKGNPFYRDDMTTADNTVWQDTDTRASRVGEANTYFLQSDARGVLSAFDDIFSRASSAARSIAGGAIQSKNLTQAGNTIYQGTFDTADWSGDLLAVPVTVDGSNVVTISTSNSWTAATKLSALASPATSRNIVVGNVGSTQNPVAAPFLFASIEQTLIDSLNRESPSATADGKAEDRVNYLRGDGSKEGSPFRVRNKKLLGDIINSGVAYSGAPTKSISSSTYTTFQSTNAARTPAVFVGSNDGMLHAFNATNGLADSGKELFAYIPSWIGPKLSALTNPSYVNNHQSYVDSPPVVAEAQLGTTDTASNWRTVLVSGTGGGGQGVFALDVTNPSTFTRDNVMWEFTHADDQDMGNVTGRPQILKMRTSASSATTATYKWFAVVGSGVNNYVTDSAGLFSSTGNPALFILDLSKPAGTAWTLNTNYYKLSLPVNSTLSATKATGLINFRAALGSAREVTQIFMGDLHGNLWKLDFSRLGTTDWDITKLSPFKRGFSSPFTPYPLFIAKDALGNEQPITMAPSIVFGPKPDTSYLLFGTGKYLESGDKISISQQSVYMVYDNAVSGGDSSPVVSAISGRSRLKQGTAVALTGLITVPAFTLGRATTNIDTEIIRSGWYFDFPNSGERQISSASVFGNSVIFGSLITGSAITGGSCSAGIGGGNQYTINIAGGNGSSTSSTVGIMGEPLVSELTGAVSYTVSDSTGRRTKTITSQVIQQGSSGLATGGTTTTSFLTGRLSWRQINNFQDLKNAP